MHGESHFYFPIGFLYLPFDIPILITIVFMGQNFTKFQPEKYDFDLYEGSSMKKMAQIFC
jgi:hypothetical protein